MKKQFWTSLAVLPLFAICAAETGKTDAKGAAQPAAAVQQAKPEWKDNAVVAGSKKVVFGKNGIITIQAGKRTALSVNPYFCIRTAEGKNHYAAPSNKPFKITVNNDGKSIQYAGDLTVEGQTWQAFTQKAELTPEGLIHITVNWYKPPQELNWKYSVFLSMNSTYEALGGSQFKINQDSLTLPAAYDPDPNKQKLGEFWRGQVFLCVFLADSPADTFAVIGNKKSNFQGIWANRNKLFRNLNFISYPDQKKTCMEFDIDIRGESK